MAMTILNIGVLAIVAAFNAGIVTVRRASAMSTASVLADQQMEQFRALTYDQIALDSTALGAVNNTYKCDTALGTGACPYSTGGEPTITCTSPIPATCDPWRSVTGPDHHQYVVATYIIKENPVASAEKVRRVVVVVRDGQNTAKVLAREMSTFDCLGAQPYTPTPTDWCATHGDG